MAKISIYLDDCRLKQIDQLVNIHPNLANRIENPATITVTGFNY